MLWQIVVKLNEPTQIGRLKVPNATPAIIAVKKTAAATHGSIARRFVRGSTVATGCINTPPGSTRVF
jgi:hypothetical protein